MCTSYHNDGSKFYISVMTTRCLNVTCGTSFSKLNLRRENICEMIFATQVQ